MSRAPPLSLTVGTNNRITMRGYSYDAAGNLTVMPGISGSLSYDAENRLTASAGVNYSYDGDGRRVKKSSGTLYWYGTSGEILQETNLSNGLLNEYVFFSGKRVGLRTAGGVRRYYLADHLGSTSKVVSEAGGLSEDFDYYPFGGAREVYNGWPQNYKFTGKERDAESGLDNFGARYYAAGLGRFLAPDWSAVPVAVPYATLSDPQSLNLYSYVTNRPTVLVDADGHDLGAPTTNETIDGRMNCSSENSGCPGADYQSQIEQAQELSKSRPNEDQGPRYIGQQAESATTGATQGSQGGTENVLTPAMVVPRTDLFVVKTSDGFSVATRFINYEVFLWGPNGMPEPDPQPHHIRLREFVLTGGGRTGGSENQARSITDTIRPNFFSSQKTRIVQQILVDGRPVMIYSSRGGAAPVLLNVIRTTSNPYQVCVNSSCVP